MMYVPAGIEPSRYIFNAVVLVAARLVFALFWLVFAGAGFLLFGLTDLVVGLAQGVLLLLFLRAEDT